MSATAVGMGRLLIWEELAFGLTTSLSTGVGFWNTEGHWRSHASEHDEYDWQNELWAQLRLSERLFVYGRVPWILTYRQTADLDEVGSGLGDMQLGARYEVLSIGEILQLPAVALLAGIVLPTGKQTLGHGAVLGTDSTSRGSWVLTAAVSIEETFQPFFVRLDLGATLPFSKERQDLGVRQRYGPGLQTGLSTGWEMVSGIVASGVLRFAWEANMSLDRRTTPASSTTDMGLGLALSWRVESHWTLVASADTGVFVSGLGDNRPGRFSTSLGVRYGYF